MTPAAGQTPTRVRYGVLAFVCALSMITYLDRAAFPNMQDSVLAALGMNDINQLGYALTAFNLAYALFEVPTGWLGDVFGPRKTLIRIVLWWSFFIAVTGLVGRVSGIVVFDYRLPEFYVYGFVVLVVIRFLFGMGEAGAYPNIARALYNWFPLRERGRASGMVWMSARLMGGLTPLVLLGLHGLNLHWRFILLLFAMLGVIWCVAFGFWFRNRPEEKAGVNEAERELIRGDRGPAEVHGGVPWRKIVTNRSVWALCLMYACTNYSWYFSMNYLPAFMQDQYEVPKNSVLGGFFKGGPLILGTLGCLVGGWLTDRYIRRTGDKKWGRRVYGMVGHGLAGLCLFAVLFIPYGYAHAWLFALVIAFSGFFNDLTMASAWAACQDVGGRYSAIVSGTMNMIGNLGGALTTFATAWINTQFIAAYAATHGFDASTMPKGLKDIAVRPGWELNFILYGMIYLLAVMCWLMVDANRPVEPAE
jgi:MFS family permease